MSSGTVLIIISCVAGLLGVFAKTRHEDGKKSITVWGWVLAAFLASAAVFQYFQERASSEESASLKSDLHDQSNALSEARSDLKAAQIQTDKMWDDLVERLGEPYNKYNVSIKTGTDPARGQDAGTDARVDVLLYGDKDKDTWRRLETHGTPFKEGETDDFTVKTKPIGNLEGIEIRRSRGERNDKGWRIASLQVKDLRSRTNYAADIPQGGLRFHVDTNLGGLKHKIPLKPQ